MKSVHLTYSDGDLIEFVQHDPSIIQLLHDDQTKFKMREGLPETYGLFYSADVVLNQAWQEFWFEQIKICSPRLIGETEQEWDRRLKKQWEGLVADDVCFTDDNSPQNGRADFIIGLNTSAEGIGHKSLATGGNLFKKTASQPKSGYYRVECLDGSKPPPPVSEVNRYRTPWLIHGATTRTKNLPENIVNGLRKVDPFPRGGPEVPYLNICNVYVKNSAGVKVFDHNYIRKDWTRDVPFRANRNPYYPER